MDSRLIQRPFVDLLSGRSQFFLSLNTTSRRHESSFRRTKLRLNVKPESSFILSNNSPQQDHIIFNPPSSAPSVFHTPLKFLPKEDKRTQLFSETAARSGTIQTRLPPPINRKPKVPHHHLSDADIAEIRRLNREDPNKWSNTKLARKFNCSAFFVTVCLSQAGGGDAVALRRNREDAKAQAVKERWGPRRRMAREDRAKRIELALRDE